VHPVDVMLENFLTALSTGVVAGVFGYVYSGGILEITILGTSLVYFFSSLLANLRHSHIPLYFSDGVSRFLSSPAMHHVHHSCESRHFDRNFAVVFSLWDHLAGTNYIPARGEKFELGIGPESKEFSSVWRAYFYPFYSLARTIRQQIAGAAAPRVQPEVARTVAAAPAPTNQPLP
jgi:sterol desaturase/sphingolipid hydroxylase (fatty acid hydroxylase superfamily)